MQELLKSSQRHLLWQDELGDEFVLTKYGEIFDYGNGELKVHTWSKWYADKIASKVRILSKDSTDDPLFILTVELRSFVPILMLGTHRRRPNLRGVWIKKAEKALCHKIIPLNPRILRKGLE